MADKQLVRLRISSELLVRHLLHLPAGTLEAASVECWTSGEAVALSLYLRYPSVPEGAVEMSPCFKRHEDGRVELAGISWYGHTGAPILVPDAEPSGG